MSCTLESVKRVTNPSFEIVAVNIARRMTLVLKISDLFHRGCGRSGISCSYRLVLYNQVIISV